MDDRDVVRLGRRPGRHWLPVSRGVHRAAAATDPVRAELLAWQAVLREDVVLTGLTAAQVRGWWLPPLPSALPVFACAGLDRNAPRRPGLVVTRHRVPPVAETVRGLRLTEPAESLLACARVLSSLDLTVVVDAALSRGAVTLEEVAAVSATRRRGAPRLRRSLSWADGRSESPWETLLRALHRTVGVAVVPQHEVFDDEGLFVARGDLWIRGTRVLHEYDGGEHLTRARQRRDLARSRRLAAARWLRRGYTAVDVMSRAGGILRDADAALGRPHRPDRIRAWHAELRESAFTPPGQARLRSHLGLDGATDGLGA